MLDYGKLPELAAILLLTGAFASVARRGNSPGAGLWLTGWVIIALHFAASMFQPVPGAIGRCAEFFSAVSLTWAAIFFMRALVPYREEPTSRWMSGAFVASNTIYIGVATFLPEKTWWLVPAAALFVLLPLIVGLVSLPEFTHPLRWTLIGLNAALTCFLLAFQYRPGDGPSLAMNAVLFTAYFGCWMHFWRSYRQPSMGIFITSFGFLAWALVFVISPALLAYLPGVRVESGVWNLPKYVVATGMILLVLERQIEHNKYLALHDDLTGLPNRRLFQDRLSSALERARRSNQQTALLLADLDAFKQVNDSLGHHVGDLLLKRVGALFSQRVRRSDTVARTGGDEFAIILEEPVTRLDAEHVGAALAGLLEAPLQLGGHTLRTSASIGIALFPADADTAETLFIAADKRMYSAKETGRGRSGSSLDRNLSAPPTTRQDMPSIRS